MTKSHNTAAAATNSPQSDSVFLSTWDPRLNCLAAQRFSSALIRRYARAVQLPMRPVASLILHEINALSDGLEVDTVDGLPHKSPYRGCYVLSTTIRGDICARSVVAVLPLLCDFRRHMRVKRDSSHLEEVHNGWTIGSSCTTPTAARARWARQLSRETPLEASDRLA